MSKGSRQRRAAAAQPATIPPRRVWFIATERDSPDQNELRLAAEAEGKGHGWDFAMRRSRQQRVLGGREKDRPYRMLLPEDARDVYQDAHLRNCLIIATHSCHIRSDASRSPATLRELLRLNEFVAYKAGYALVRGVADVRSAMTWFASSWPPRDGCQGQHDPRALPLHVFDPAATWASLDAEEGRADFDVQYQRRAGSRNDGSGRSWQQPTALHGSAGPQRSVMRVAGVPLPQGYHWDVQRGRGRDRLLTESEVWLLDRANAYVNIYPNGYVRGERRRGARKVWP